MTRKILNFKIGHKKGTGEIVDGGHNDEMVTYKVVPINGKNFKEFTEDHHLWVTHDQVSYFESIFTSSK